MFSIPQYSFSIFLILYLNCLISKIISFSEEEFDYIERTQPTPKLRHDYGNVSQKLVIFDTDKTIWPFRTDCGNVSSPFTKLQGDVVVDKKGNKFAPYPQVKDVFLKLKLYGHKIGVIAQNPDCDTIFNLLSLFDFGKYIDYKACFVGPKPDLVMKLHQESHFSYDDILYLDDEYFEIPDIMALNATAMLSSEQGGITWDDVQRGLDIFTFVGPWRLTEEPPF